ncbi:MAG TPA: hypothetical protein VEH77_02435 [Roseiarcus sp.]|nr:hypothetical protein [Roseiarcus sp.]
MRVSWPAAPRRTDSRRYRADSELVGAGGTAPQAPLAMVARLGVLLAIALGFGLAAQGLTGAFH